MTRGKLYIAGPMSGIKDFNFPAFKEIEDKLQSLRYETVNPANLNRDYVTSDFKYNMDLLKGVVKLSTSNYDNLTKEDFKKIWAFFLKRDVAEMLTCDAVVVLDGWKRSEGAAFEVKTALTVKMKIYELHEDELVEVSNKGMKFGAEKLRWDLLPWEELRDVVEILTVGAEKYEPNNWQQVEDPEKAFFRPLQGHIMDWHHKSKIDDEEGGSGKSHLAHAVCNALFLMWFDKQQE